ncbi:hypothetical protein K3Q61_004048 [Escherichia coli]|nr:hypothetical protein [Escherichia coli]
MGRINLRVPYEEKDEVKKLGAKWDWNMRIWYIPENLSHEAFSKWLLLPNTKAESFSIARVMTDCWSCKKDTYVYTIFFDEGYYYKDYNEDTDEVYWEHNHYPAMLCHVEYVSADAQLLIEKHTQCYNYDYSKKAKTHYVMNHCIHCGAKHGDFLMHGEPGGEFNPVTPEKSRKIRIISFKTPIECRASDSYYNDFYKSIRYQRGWKI